MLCLTPPGFPYVLLASQPLSLLLTHWRPATGSPVEDPTEAIQMTFCVFFCALLDGYRDCLFYRRSTDMPKFSVSRFSVTRPEESLPFFRQFFQSQVRVEVCV
jgi:hypothetical protein